MSVLCGFLAVFTIPSATYLVAAVFAWAGGVLALQYANADLPAERLARPKPHGTRAKVADGDFLGSVRATFGAKRIPFSNVWGTLMRPVFSRQH